MQHTNIRYRACLLGLVSAACLASQPAMAAETMAAKPSVPSIGEIMDAQGINVHGYIDASYTYAPKAMPGSLLTYRIFDRERNSFNIQMMDLTISKLPADGFGGLVSLKAGPDANVIAASGTNTTDDFDFAQAYLHFADGPLMVIAGKFATLAGAELIEGPSNMNFSHAYMFGYGPYTHTGVRGYYTINDMVKVIAGVNNGWDNFKDDNGDKTWEFSVGLTPVKPLAVNLSYYTGKEGSVTSTATLIATADGKPAARNYVDLVATYTPIDPLTLVLNYASGSQKNGLVVGETAKWNSVALYANYKIGDTWRVAWRGESFDDKDGYRLASGKQKVRDVVLTLAYMPSSNTEFRVEARNDKSNQASFAKTDGSSSKTQSSFAVEGIYKF